MLFTTLLLYILLNRHCFIVVAPYKTPVILFDNADVDSAIEKIIDTTFGYQGLPWSTNTILVQENILPSFVNKLETRLASLRVGLANDNTADISCADETSTTRTKSLIAQAKDQGTQIIRANENACWSPTVFVGERVQNNTVLYSRDSEETVLTLSAFRTIEEAINLANNNKQGFGVTVWSENIGIVNEVARKLKVANVWINNSSCCVAADVTSSPIKHSGIGYFGGKEGFYEYVQINDSNQCPAQCPQVYDSASLKMSDTFAAIINTAKKSQDSWSNVPRLRKIDIYHQMADYLDSNKKQLRETVTEEWLDNLTAAIYECICESNQTNSTCLHSGFNLTSSREPRGLIIVQLDNDQSINKVVLCALALGNAVILVTGNIGASVFKNIAKFLPNGVLSVVPNVPGDIKTAAAHKGVDLYIGNKDNAVFGLLPLRDSQIFSTVTSNWDDIYRKVTVVKNIWSDVGKSCNCTLGNY